MASSAGAGSAAALRRLGQTRDAQAWTTLLELHGRDILQACQRILRDGALAEDACQETLLQVREKAAQFKGEEDAAARVWILRVAYNTALQMLRSRRSAISREDAHGRAPLAPQRAEAPTVAHETSETVAVVQRELGQMAEEERLPILLHFYEGLAYEELSVALACPVGTAKARVHRGLERLRKRLAVFGIAFGFPDLSEFLRESAGRTGQVAAPSQTQLEQWRRLLESERTPSVSPPFEGGERTTPSVSPAFEGGENGTAFSSISSQKGFSRMAKLGMGAAAVVLLGVLVALSARTNGADTAGTGRSSDVGPVARAGTQPGLRETRAEAEKPPATADEKAALSRGINAFALDFYGRLKDSEKGNIFFSPYSISTALAMTYAGARGETAAQMEMVLRFSLKDRLHPVCGGMIQALNATEKDGKPRGFQLTVANRLFGQKDYKFVPEFLELNRNTYGAPLEEVDFKNETEAARQTINTWVAQKTQDKIKDIVPPGGLSPATRLALANAIYFKGDWASAFDKKATREAPFHLASAQDVNVPLMFRKAEFRVHEMEKGVQVLQLPYKNDELSMIVFLPPKADGLPQLEKSLSANLLARTLEALTKGEPEELEVLLPKFKLTWGTVELSETLKSMGMQDAFSLQADFSGMSTQLPRIMLGAVFHKAFVDVNEQGTEAAAATVAVAKDGGMPEPAKVFRADHPFLFLIRENATGAILFMGRLTDPR